MNYEKLLGDFDKTIIKLNKTYHIEPLTWEDTAQELRIHLWVKRDKYDQKRDYNNWAYITCKKKLIDLARHYNAQKRCEAKKTSLNKLLEEGYEF